MRPIKDRANLTVTTKALVRRVLFEDKRAVGVEFDVDGQSRTARAKGLSMTRVVTGHALRNALLPMVTIVALSFGRLFSGALITETMFAWHGMGKMIYDAILGNDYNLALIGLMFATALTLIGNFLADIGYVWLDPRVSLSDRGRGA